MAEDKQNAETTIIKNTSQAYGYKYSSLADIAKAGVEIPKMRVKPTENGEYVEYLDDNGEWQIGAKVVIPEMKGGNAAQAYGSALTYARRYTVQLAKSLACDDDSKIEKQPPVKGQGDGKKQEVQQNNKGAVDWGSINIIKAKLPTLTEIDQLDKFWTALKLKPEGRTAKILLPAFTRRKHEIQKETGNVE